MRIIAALLLLTATISSARADIITVPDLGWWMQVSPPSTIPDYYFETPIGDNDGGSQLDAIANQILASSAPDEYALRFYQCDVASGCTFDLQPGQYGTASPSAPFMPSDTPEPATLVLLGGGLIGMGLLKRRRSA